MGTTEIRATANQFLKGAIDRAQLLNDLADQLMGMAADPVDRAAIDATRAIATALAELPDIGTRPGEDTPTTTGTIYTDGSAVPNPGAGGWAAVWVDGERIVREAEGAEAAATNNRMELRALIAGFEMMPPGAAITVVTDSQLCVNTITKWAAAWRRAGWRRKKGTIANLDLVKKLFALYEAHPECALRWTRGHAGNRWNEHADRLANHARSR